MDVLGDSFIPNFGPTVPFPSSPLSCLMGQVRKLVPLVKGSHPRSVGQFKAGFRFPRHRKKEGGLG